MARCLMNPACVLVVCVLPESGFGLDSPLLPTDDSGKFNLALPTCQFSPDDLVGDRDSFFTEISRFGRGAAIIGTPFIYIETEGREHVVFKQLKPNIRVSMLDGRGQLLR